MEGAQGCWAELGSALASFQGSKAVAGQGSPSPAARASRDLWEP